MSKRHVILTIIVAESITTVLCTLNIGKKENCYHNQLYPR